jgi:hypothetical protein
LSQELTPYDNDLCLLGTSDAPAAGRSAPPSAASRRIDLPVREDVLEALKAAASLERRPAEEIAARLLERALSQGPIPSELLQVQPGPRAID